MTTAAITLLQMGPHYGQMDGGWMGVGWTGWAGILAMIVFALLLAAVVFALVRLVFVPLVEATDRYDEERTTDPALATLRERFARGEIDEEEYERRRRTLTGKTA
jgi:putative membrane protein